jgi:hypothetical protein
MSSTTGSSTSCGLFGFSTIAWPLAVSWTIADSGSQLVMRLSMPCSVGPVFWPVFWPVLTGTIWPTDTSQTMLPPAVGAGDRVGVAGGAGGARTGTTAGLHRQRQRAVARGRVVDVERVALAQHL